MAEPIPMYLQAAELAKAGHPPAEIAVALGISPRSAHDFLKYARHKGHSIPAFKRGHPRPVGKYRVIHVRRDALEALASIARGMGLNTAQLAADLLMVIATDDLVDAILDRGGDDD